MVQAVEKTTRHLVEDCAILRVTDCRSGLVLLILLHLSNFDGCNNRPLQDSKTANSAKDSAALHIW